MSYAGVPRQTIAFLAGLAANNSRDWFEAHRADYEAHWLGAGLDLAAALAGPVSALGLGVEPKLNASLRRIQRDVRFSHDKRPYEPRLHLIFTATHAFNKEAGVHLVIGAAGIGYGAGVYALPGEWLERYRAAILDPVRRAGFLAAVRGAADLGCELDPPELARLPKGVEAAPEWEHLMRRKSVILRTQKDLPHPDWLFDERAVEGWMGIVRTLVPMVDWCRGI